jgi:hypothetical protein
MGIHLRGKISSIRGIIVVRALCMAYGVEAFRNAAAKECTAIYLLSYLFFIARVPTASRSMNELTYSPVIPEREKSGV